MSVSRPQTALQAMGPSVRASVPTIPTTSDAASSPSAVPEAIVVQQAAATALPKQVFVLALVISNVVSLGEGAEQHLAEAAGARATTV